MSEFRMPSLGADMEDGLFVEWMVKPGERVARGQVVCAIETQKGAVDVEIWDTGVIEELVAEPGQRIPVGGVLARLSGADEAPMPHPEPGEAEPPRAAVSVERSPRPAPAHRKATAPAERLRISPAARRRAAELGLDVTTLRPGADGVVHLADVEAASRPAPKSAPKPAVGDDARRVAMREAIAAAMARSKREIPHYYLDTLINVEPALRWLEARNAGVAVADRALFAALQLRAVALALADYPSFNGWYEEGAFRPSVGAHLGVAIALRGGGLVAPALRDADRFDLAGLMEALRDLLQRARGGALRSSELSDTSLTVTNLGDLGVDRVLGVIYPPQVALVGFGRVAERPWVEDGKLFAARSLCVSLAADHRVTDGALGARFLSRIADALQEPEHLWPD